MKLLTTILATIMMVFAAETSVLAAGTTKTTKSTPAEKSAPATTKKSTKAAKVKVEQASTWTKKAKNYEGKTVATMVESVQHPGTIMSDAPAGVILIETGTAKKSDHSRIYVVIPASKVKEFETEYMPEKAAGGTKSFGANKIKKQITGVFTVHKDVPVLLAFDFEKSKLAKLPAISELYSKQGGEDDNAEEE